MQHTFYPTYKDQLLYSLHVNLTKLKKIYFSVQFYIGFAVKILYNTFLCNICIQYPPCREQMYISIKDKREIENNGFR
jgi:hypothetical protein